jgi:predicted lipoprotein
MKAGKYIIAIVIIMVVAYNSVYFKKLDEVKAAATAKEFNAAQYAKDFWTNKLIPNLGKATDVNQLTAMFSDDAAKTFDTYSHALGIGNLRYFLVKGKGEVTAVNDDALAVSLKSDTGQQTMTIATEYIFGNEVRDATGFIDINEFSNTMDFNNVSSELNKIIREKVLPSFKSVVKKGNTIEFVGAIELNKEHLNLQKIEIIPIEIKIVH